MTTEETVGLVRYLLCMYPNVKMDDKRFRDTVAIWSNEFANDSKDVVQKAVREATMQSPDWMPNLPQIKNLIREIACRIKVKTPEEEFKDTHGGKTKEQWDAMIAWENSQEGIVKLRSYKKQLQEIFKRR